ncbi:MBL fold metallo-hydrolase [Candidatus Gottesmanbacteria bacterium]|nr:MBL fold metallo-hydrolase [Candidatus Gottesmanbacteria bacterium]
MKKHNLKQIDRLEVLVLVDNTTDSLSSNPDNVSSEWKYLKQKGRLTELSGKATCCAHHGLSLLITTHQGDVGHSLLFDTGPDASTYLRNAEILGIDHASINSIVFSHGHWDHGAGLVPAIEACVKERGHEQVDCFVHPDMFAERGMMKPDGKIDRFESVPSPNALTKAGTNVINSRDPQLTSDSMFYISGEIPRVTKYETGFPGHMRREPGTDSWQPDPLIMDERFVAVNIKDKGIFVFSGCSHAGVVNVLTHARDLFPEIPIYGICGGLHLAGNNERIISETMEGLKKFNLALIAPGHCTGWRAVNALADEFMNELVPLAVGKHFEI